MSTSAPRSRMVNALTGEKAPGAFFKALSEADHFVSELDGLHELRTRVAELEGALKLARADADDATETTRLLLAENAQLTEAKDWLDAMVLALAVQRDELTVERDNLASDLADLREAHKHTVDKLATAHFAMARREQSGW